MEEKQEFAEAVLKRKCLCEIARPCIPVDEGGGIGEGLGRHERCTEDLDEDDSDDDASTSLRLAPTASRISAG